MTLSTTVPGKNTGDIVLVDFIPAFPGGCIVFRENENGMQISGEGKAFVKDQRDAVVAVTGGVNDFAVYT